MNRRKKFELENIMLQSAAPNNVILPDETGEPSVMVRIPKMSYSQLGLEGGDETHPAFIVDGREVEYIYISKYGNIIKDGRAYSLPGEDPQANIGFYDALNACAQKGKGWHLMTRAEYAVIAQWCAVNGCIPRGNNANGKDYREKTYRAAVLPNGHTLTGSGPGAWYHDGTFAGIADLNGNTSDWMGGIRMVNGELQMLKNNDGADNANDQRGNSRLWMAIDGTTGEFVMPDGCGTTQNSLKLDFIFDTNKTCCWRWVMGEIHSRVDNSRNDEYSNIKAEEGICPKAIRLLQAYALLPSSSDPMEYEHNKLHCRNTGSNMHMHCGGSFHDYADSGLYFTRICDSPEHATAGIGFRCSYIEL